MWTFFVFEASYLARAAFDLIFVERILDDFTVEEFKEQYYPYLVLIMFSYAILDGLPLFLLLLFHLRNFVLKPRRSSK